MGHQDTVHHDIQDLIYAAWKRVRPRLEDEPALLAQRLQRRRTPTLTRPPRAWCIALRASDHRIASSAALVHPSSLSLHPCDPEEHTITLTTPLLRSVTAPIHLTAPGETLSDAARLLGTSPAGLLNIRLKGTVRTHHIPPMCYRGHPQPLLYIEHPLDPCAKGFLPQDPLWAWTANFLATRIPENFEQTLTRVPVFKSHAPKHRYDEYAHPELGDAVPRKSRRLPEPLIEPTCWYKWSASGHYLGNDPTNWRKTFQDQGNRPRRDRPRRGNAQRRPAPSSSQGSLHFNGFHWLCPACGKSCRTIYLPVDPINLLKRSQPKLANVVDIQKPKFAGTFACWKCHRVRVYSAIDRGSWNHLISYLTAGLLYGREVPRPAAYIPQRKRAYAPQHNRKSPRRDQVLRRLLNGWTFRQIATDLKIRLSAVDNHLTALFRQHGVPNRHALAQKLKSPHPQPMTQEENAKHRRLRIEQLLLQGRSYQSIMQELNIPFGIVNADACKIYKTHQVKNRPALQRKHGITPDTPAARTRATIRALRAAGLTWRAIASKLQMTFSAVDHHAKTIRREEKQDTLAASPLPA